VAGYEPDTGGIAASHDTEAVVLDLVNPIRSCWRLLGRRRQTRFNETGSAPTTRHGRLIGMSAARVE
jgi:hypothetical protein